LALCPSIAYAAALDPDGIDDPTYAVTLLPDATTRTLEQSLNGFSASLMAQACGRDLYSPVWTCQDCMDEYREWLCRTLVPRCAGSDPTGTARQKTVRVASRRTDGHVPGPGYEYTQLLPCLANCRRVDRKCPVNLQFRCPLRGKTANMTYAYVGAEEEDGGRGEGEEDGGVDEWGNRWCNGGLPG
jgi:calcium channel MID1